MMSPEGREMIDRFRRDRGDDEHRDVLWEQMQRRIVAEASAAAPVRRGAIAIAIAVIVAAAAALVLWLRPEPRVQAIAAPGEQASDRAAQAAEAIARVPAPVPAELPIPPRVEAVPPPASPPTLQRSASSAAPTIEDLSADDPFAREVAMIRGAREAALRADWDAVATLLDRHGQAFPAGALRRERMTLAIDRLCARGESDRALEHARRLLATFPGDATAQRRASTPCPADSVTKPTPSGQ